ncbi:DUF1697 domain-containing protein [Stagnihabitans tardus]|uniref:DUF1697 domain-containing protein n=1 Tax=Stagnihabitans tardus TaxID=2699202 RepID=A0AAE4YGR8_9RHOB|nr:DUF1697 domain-containing protein [Stagnihabitans tardus]NBZ89849.1 DUF1697 domain-containing protein [Stagnihabitans tardus]
MKDRLVLMLRGVNVGGVKLPMAAFRNMLAGLGLEDVASHIQSGNAVFRAGLAAEGAGAASLARLEARIAEGLAAEFGLAVPLFLWRLADYEALLAACPFQAEGAADGASVHLVFHRAELAPGLEAHATAGERVLAGAGVLYLHAPRGFGRSELVTRLPRYLKGDQTARNWRSCVAVRELARGLAEGP